MVATFAKSPVRNTCTWFNPPTVTYAKVPLALLAKLTWLVIGPVSIVFSTVNGGRASNTITLPTSFSVNQTCEPSGVAAILGQKGLACGTRPTIWGSAPGITPSLGGKDQQTDPT